MWLDNLYTPKPPWIWLHPISKEDAEWLPEVLYGKPGMWFVVRVLRGRKMTTVQDLMNEFGAALQFFDLFGENWNALYDCLTSLDDRLPSDVYILVIRNPEKVLVNEPDELVQFRSVLEDAGEWWSRPIVGKGQLDRLAVPFHPVLECNELTLPEVQARYPGVPILEHGEDQ